MLHQQVWARDPQEVGKRHHRRQRQTEDKQSQRWLSALQVTESAVPEEIEVVTIADREADIYDLFAKPHRERCALSRPASLTHLLIRGTHNRRVNHEAEYLHTAIRQTPIVGELTIEVPRGDERPFRQAVRWIAQLGGFLGRKHDGAPGVKTIWRRWQRLQDIGYTWQLLHSHQPTQPQL